MEITINTEVLKKEHLTMREFLVLLIGYYDVEYKDTLSKLIREGLVHPNVFDPCNMVLSNNTKNLIASILLESDIKARKTGIDFDSLAKKLQEIYPAGTKPGKSYSWRGDAQIVAQKLRTVVVRCGFYFTEEEAIAATKEYVNSFKEDDITQMSLLENFILKIKRQPDGSELDSMLMTIIENNR